MKITKDRSGTAEKDSAAPGLFYFALFVLSVPGVQEENRPYPGLLPAMDGFKYIENNNLSFISYNDCNYHKPHFRDTRLRQMGRCSMVKAKKFPKIPIFTQKSHIEQRKIKNYRC